MSRPVMLSNGTMMVGLDEFGLVHDFYYPYVGLENLVTSRQPPHKIGVWVDDVFSWIDDGSWDTTVDFSSEALISDVSVTNDSLGVSLHFQDFVDSDFNAFFRHIRIGNNTKDKRNIRLFMHQVFLISRSGRADTALFVPEENYILDYKGRCCLLAYGQKQNSDLFDQFAIGNFGIEGKEGTFRDAEDGELSGSAVEHGGVDSVMRFSCDLDAGQFEVIDYWVVAADSQYSAEKIHHSILKESPVSRLNATLQKWQQWLSVSTDKLDTIDATYRQLTKKSLMLIKAHTDKRGGILASGDSSIYNYGRDYYSYVWPRDGAYAIWPLIRLGYTEEAKRFFEFCRDILNPDGYLMHKYQPDRAIGSTWHPLLHGRHKELAIQEDETAIVIFMLREYYEKSGDTDFVRNLYATLIQPAANFMSSFIDPETKLPHASYDLWEEKFLTTTYTVALVFQSLQAAAAFAEDFEYPDDAVLWRDTAQSILSASNILFNKDKRAYYKGLLLDEQKNIQFDDTIDTSSFYGSMMYGLYSPNHHELHDTVNSVKEALGSSPAGGISRYEHDAYFRTDATYMGNPWIITSLWLAQYYIRVNKFDLAKDLMSWTQRHTLTSGALPEQINPSDGTPLSVTPLVWSHAEFINTVLDLANID